jgi:copper oxidase (laccase) domain-containing protein
MAAAADAFVDATSLFRPNGKAQHAHFDMWAANRRQLAAGGVKQIIETELCTACHTDHFFSHRAENGQTGRFGVMMGLRGVA